jgi:hypothetical protein
MKAIELTQALINASEATINKVDALVETCVLRQLIESCKARVDLLEDEALSIAEQQLAAHGETSGKFMYMGHHYTIDSVPVFDLIGKRNKYNTAEAATYRRKAREQQKLKKQSAMLTKKMKAILDEYPINHPNLAPDALKRTLKCLD